MNNKQQDIAKAAAISGVLFGIGSSDPVIGLIVAAGTVKSMNAGYDAAVEEIALMEEANRARTISVSGR